MTGRCFSILAAGAALSALLTITTVLAAANEGRVRLDQNLLARSRGSDPNSTIYWTTCSLVNQMQTCMIGQGSGICQGCADEENLQFTGPGSPGGYNSGGQNPTCGALVTFGTCDYDGSPGLWCTGSGSGSYCNTPSGVSSQ